MTIQETILKLKLRTNKLDSQAYDNLQLWTMIEALNKASINVVSLLYGQNNTYKSGFESTRKRVDDLQKLMTDEPYKLNISKIEKEKGFVITNKLPDDYLHYIRSIAIASKNKCIKNIRLYQAEESNINTYLANEFIKPSFLWAESLVVISNDKLKVYVDDFNIDYIDLYYLKVPPKMDISGYTKLDGSSSIDIHPIFNDDVMELIIDHASRIIKGDIQDMLGVNISQNNISLNE